MASSDRRPSIKGKKRAQARPSCEGAVDVAREEPADFFDLGDFDDGPSPSEGASRQTRKEAKRAKRRLAQRKLAADAVREAPQESSERSVPSDSSRSERPGRADRPKLSAERPVRSTSRKATEREKAIVRGRRRKIAWVIAVSALAVAVAVSGLLFWNAYLRYDDAADIRGEWQVADGSMTVVIDADSINMPDSLAYEYRLDTWEKTISFSFEDLSGKGTYRFSSDRRGVVIQEGEGQDAAEITLVKVSDDESAEPHLGSAQVEDGAEEQAASDAADASDAAAQGDASETAAQDASVSDGASQAEAGTGDGTADESA